MKKLIDEINVFREEFSKHAPQEVQDTIQTAIENLESENLESKALKIGDKIKSFTLLNAINKEISIDEILKNNDFAVINFYRGGWCPFCNIELKALQDINTELKALNTSLIAISPQTPDSSLTTQEKNELDFEVLSDSGNQVAIDFGLSYELPEDIYELLKQLLGTDLEIDNGDKTHTLPIPATYIVNKNKEVIYSFVSADYRKREEPQTILDIIKENS